MKHARTASCAELTAFRWGQDVPTENQTITPAYLISGAGDPSENARSNDARSSGGMSETAI